MKTLKISEIIQELNRYKESIGDASVVLYDYDSDEYFSIKTSNFVAQSNNGTDMRISIGIKSYNDDKEPYYG